MVSRMRSELPGEGQVEYVLTVATEVTPGASAARLRVESGDVLRADGTSVQGPQNHYKSMRGLEFTLTRGADGLFGNPQGMREDVTGSDAFSILMMTMTFNMQPVERRGLKPGDTWKHSAAGEFPLMPGTKWSTNYEYKLEGFGEQDGRAVAYVSSRGTMKVENGILNRTTTPTYVQKLVARSMVVESSGRTAFDRATSEMIGSNESSTTKLNLESHIVVQGREPIIRPVSDFEYRQVGTIDVTYTK